MKYIHDEILFTNSEQALKHADLLLRNGFTIDRCGKCGIVFGSADPYTSDAGVLCRVCMHTLNLDPESNYRPDDRDYAGETEFEFYNENALYGRVKNDNKQR